MVDMSHNGHYRSTRLEGVGIILIHGYTHLHGGVIYVLVVIVFVIIEVIVLARDDLAKSFRHCLARGHVQCLGNGSHDAQVCHQVFNDRHRRFTEDLGQLANRHWRARQHDGLPLQRPFRSQGLLRGSILPLQRAPPLAKTRCSALLASAHAERDASSTPASSAPAGVVATATPGATASWRRPTALRATHAKVGPASISISTPPR
mmetsp:Transcript_7373/g.18294  ORF Transcript_7373/g.18294 Transcript_7373/m.18294 type:complete len:205 (-) Transcript_7373:28-642(-)